MTPYSLRRRLLIWLLAATAFMGAMALADTWREALRTAQSVSDRVLAGSALAIAERVTVDETGGLEVNIPYSALEMLTSTAQDQVFYRVDGPENVFLTGYDTLTAVSVGEDGIGFADGQFGDVAIRSATLQRQISTGDGSVSFAVTVAESTLARNALARAILVRSALRLSAMILGAATIAWIAVTVALRPLNLLGEAIAMRSPDDLRPIREATPQEVEGLVEAINSFMQRLDTSLAGLRNFTGNASHQLRTPLAVVRTQLAVAARQPDPAQRGAATDKADAALARAERILAQLLVLARVDATAGESRLAPVNVAQLARDLTAEMVPAASRAEIDLGYEGLDDLLVQAEPVLFAEMLRNLLDNAIFYAGKGSTVTVRTRLETDSAIVEVEDNGQGLTLDQKTALANRKRDGVAGSSRLAQGGYGLGVAIVQEIAKLFGASQQFTTGPGQRGLIVRTSFARNTGLNRS